MVLHLGDDVVLHTRDLVLMLDLDSANVADTHAFIGACHTRGQVRRITRETPKTAVLAMQKDKPTLYLSPISSATLLKRVERPDYEAIPASPCAPDARGKRAGT